jgi:hypothetical protein
MKPNLNVVKIDRRRLLTTLAGGGAAFISGAANAAPERMFRFVSPGDAVIVTNAELVATDPGFPRVEELARRLDYALRNRKTLGHVTRAQSRFFALSSVTLNGPFDSAACRAFQTTLARQSEVVSHSFGSLAVDDLPFYIATSIEDDRGVLEPVLDVLAYITDTSGFWRDAEIVSSFDIFCTVNASTCSSGALDLIALWPFTKEG